VPEEEIRRLQQEAFATLTTCVYCSQPMTFRQWCAHIVDCTRRLYNDRERVAAISRALEAQQQAQKQYRAKAARTMRAA
jgi:hypothetical protein